MRVLQGLRYGLDDKRFKGAIEPAPKSGHTDAENEYGEPLRQEESGRGNIIQGSAGAGPQMRLETGRGSVTVRKASAEDTTVPDIPNAPTPAKPPKPPNPPLKVEHQ